MEFFDIAKELSPALSLLVIGMAIAIRSLWLTVKRKDQIITGLTEKLIDVIKENTASNQKLSESFEYFKREMS